MDSRRPSLFDPKKKLFREARTVRSLLNQPSDAIDLVRMKLAVDKMIDPSIDVDANLRRIGAMAAQVGMLPEFGRTDASKLLALKKYLYESGPWNGHRAFEYDLEDPLGTKISNKLMPNYLTTRKGNCVTMPLLVVLLGQRLGIDVTASTAPKHVLVKWKNEVGAWINLEATSGIVPTRDVWIR